MPIKSAAGCLSIKRPGSAVPLHMGVCCVEIGDEMVPLKRKRERKKLVTVAVYPLAVHKRPKKVGTRVRGGKK